MALLDDLMSPQTSVHVGFFGDSNTWGSGASGTLFAGHRPDSGLTPVRTHKPETPRDGFTSASYVNNFRRWVNTVSCNSQDLVELAPGSSKVSQKTISIPFKDDRFRYPFIKVGTSTRNGPLNNSYIEIHSGQAMTFNYTGSDFTIIHSKQGNDDWVVRVDGSIAAHWVTDGTASWQSRIDVSVPFGVHCVEIKNNAASGRCRIEAIEFEKSVTVDNNGISGIGSRHLLPEGLILRQTASPELTHAYIMIGTNDRGTNIPTGSPPVPLYTEINLRKTCNWILDEIGCELTLISPPPVGLATDTFSTVDNKHRADDQAQMVRQLASDMRLGYVAGYEALSARHSYESVLTQDLLHLNDLGHYVLFDEIVRTEIRLASWR